MFKFFGSKYLLAKRYPPPIYPVIVEPFAGSAAYSVLHGADRDVVLIEKDPRVVDLWHRLLAMAPISIRSLPDPVPGQRSDDLLVAFAAGRTTRDTPSEFAVSPRMAQRFRPMVERIAQVVDRCRHFRVICGDYTDAPDTQATWFIDPPYQYQGGRWDRSRGGRYAYPNRDIDYGALGEWVRSRRGQVIVCEQEGATWLPWNGHIAARDNGHRAYREVMWTNEVPV